MRNQKTQKFVAFITSLFFVLEQIAFAAPGLSYTPHFASEVSIPKYSALEIPSNLASVESHFAGSEAFIVHIQEAHGNYEGQKKISQLLEYLEKNYGIDLILLEGNVSRLNPNLGRFFSDEARNKELLERLAQKSLASGVEMHLAANASHASAYGIENKEAYRLNGETFVRVIEDQKRNQTYIRELDGKVRALAAQKLNKKLRDFLAKQEGVEAGTLDLGVWIKDLSRYAQSELNIDLSDVLVQLEWPMLVRLLKLKDFEARINLEVYEKESASFLQAIEPYYSKNLQGAFHHIEVLLQKPFAQEKELSGLELELLFEQLVGKLPKKFDYSKYPNVSLVIGHLLIASELEAVALMEEVDQLARKIIDRLAVTDQEKKIAAAVTDTWMLAKLFQLELTEKEYSALQGKKSLLDAIAEVLYSINGNRGQIKHLSEMKALYQKTLEFYSQAVSRDQWMLQNIEKRLQESGKSKAVVITGGFHSEPFKNYFRQRGYEYALLSPKISEIETRENYFNSILNYSSPTKKSTYRQMELVMTPRSELAEMGRDAAAIDRAVRNEAELLGAETRAELRAITFSNSEPLHGMDAGLAVLAQAKLPEKMLEAHQFALENSGKEISLRALQAAARINPFIATGLNIKKVPGKEDAYLVQSQLGQFIAPEENAQHPEWFGEVAREIQQIKANMHEAFGVDMDQINWFGMGGSAMLGKAMSGVGLVPGLTVFDTSDPTAFRGLQEKWAGKTEGIAPADLIEALQRTFKVGMTMGMTSEEPVINLAILNHLLEELGIAKEGGPDVRGITLRNSSLEQFMQAVGWTNNLAQLQLNGLNSAPGRGSGPTITKFAYWLLGLLGNYDEEGLKRWNEMARLSPEAIRTFQELALSLHAYVKAGRKKVMLVVPQGYEGVAQWFAQIIMESEGIKQKDIYNQVLENSRPVQDQIKIVTDVPEDLEADAVGNDSIVLVLNVDETPLSEERQSQLSALRDRKMPVLTLGIPNKEYLPALLQGFHHVAATLIGYKWQRNFITQPSVEEYKAIAKIMIVEAMQKGGFLSQEFTQDEYFKALVKWVLRDNPVQGKIEDSPTYQKALGASRAEFGGSDGIQIYYDADNIDERSLRQKLEDLGVEASDPVYIMEALLKMGKDSGRDRMGIEISHGGDLTHSLDGQEMAELLQEFATEWVRRPFQVSVDITQVPESNHHRTEQISNESGLTIFFMPREFAEPHVGRYPSDYIKAQNIASIQALRKNGRPVVVISYPENTPAAHSLLRELKNRVARELGGRSELRAAEQSLIPEGALWKNRVQIYSTRQKTDEAAARDIVAKMKEIFEVEKKDRIVIDLASAPSQTGTWREIVKLMAAEPDYWRDKFKKTGDKAKIKMLHFDENSGKDSFGKPIDADHKMSFRWLLRDGLFNPLAEALGIQFEDFEFYPIHGETDSPEAEARRYAGLIDDIIDISIGGAGENAHWAYNDPPADFNEEKLLKVVDIAASPGNAAQQLAAYREYITRVEDLPRGITQTFAVAKRARFHFLIVPGPNKADAIYQSFTAKGPTPKVPVSFFNFSAAELAAQGIPGVRIEGVKVYVDEAAVMGAFREFTASLRVREPLHGEFIQRWIAQIKENADRIGTGEKFSPKIKDEIGWFLSVSNFYFDALRAVALGKLKELVNAEINTDPERNELFGKFKGDPWTLYELAKQTGMLYWNSESGSFELTTADRVSPFGLRPELATKPHASSTVGGEAMRPRPELRTVSPFQLMDTELDISALVPGDPVVEQILIVSDNTGVLTPSFSEPLRADMTDSLFHILAPQNPNLKSALIVNSGDPDEGLVGTNGHPGSHSGLIQKLLTNAASRPRIQNYHFVTGGGGRRFAFAESGEFAYRESIKDWPVSDRINRSRAITDAFYDEILSLIQTGRGSELPSELSGITEAEIKIARRISRELINLKAESDEWWSETPKEEKKNVIVELFSTHFGKKVFIYDSGSKLAIESAQLGDHNQFPADFYPNLERRVRAEFGGARAPFQTFTGTQFLDLTETSKLDGVLQTGNAHVFGQFDPQKPVFVFVLGDGGNDIPTLAHAFNEIPNVVVIPIFLSHDQRFAPELPETAWVSRLPKVPGAVEIMQFIQSAQGKRISQIPRLGIRRWHRSELRMPKHQNIDGDGTFRKQAVQKFSRGPKRTSRSSIHEVPKRLPVDRLGTKTLNGSRAVRALEKSKRSELRTIDYSDSIFSKAQWFANRDGNTEAGRVFARAVKSQTKIQKGEDQWLSWIERVAPENSTLQNQLLDFITQAQVVHKLELDLTQTRSAALVTDALDFNGDIDAFARLFLSSGVEGKNRFRLVLGQKTSMDQLGKNLLAVGGDHTQALIVIGAEDPYGFKSVIETYRIHLTDGTRLIYLNTANPLERKILNALAGQRGWQELMPSLSRRSELATKPHASSTISGGAMSPRPELRLEPLQKFRVVDAEQGNGIPAFVAKSKAEVYDAAVEIIAQAIKKHAADYEAGRTNKLFILGGATGGTMETLWDLLVDRFKKDSGLTFKYVLFRHLDEYVNLGLEHHDQSYEYYLASRFVNRLDEIDPERAIQPGNVRYVNGKAEDLDREAVEYAQDIQNRGNADLWLLGIGPKGSAHYAFVEPIIRLNQEYFNFTVTENSDGKVYQKLRNENEFFIQETQSAQDAAGKITAILNKRQIIHFELGQLFRDKDLHESFYEAQITYAKAHIVQWLRVPYLALRRAWFSWMGKLDPAITAELTALAERIGKEQVQTFYIPGIQADPVLAQNIWDLLPVRFRSIVRLKDSSEYNQEPAKVVSLSLETILANFRFFRHLRDVPLRAITMVRPPLDAKVTLHLALGSGKAEPVRDAILEEMSPEVSSSWFQEENPKRQSYFLIDEAAAQLLTPMRSELRRYEDFAAALEKFEPMQPSEAVTLSAQEINVMRFRQLSWIARIAARIIWGLVPAQSDKDQKMDISTYNLDWVKNILAAKKGMAAALPFLRFSAAFLQISKRLQSGESVDLIPSLQDFNLAQLMESETAALFLQLMEDTGMRKAAYDFSIKISFRTEGESELPKFQKQPEPSQKSVRMALDLAAGKIHLGNRADGEDIVLEPAKGDDFVSRLIPAVRGAVAKSRFTAFFSRGSGKKSGVYQFVTNRNTIVAESLAVLDVVEQLQVIAKHYGSSVKIRADKSRNVVWVAEHRLDVNDVSSIVQILNKELSHWLGVDTFGFSAEEDRTSGASYLRLWYGGEIFKAEANNVQVVYTALKVALAQAGLNVIDESRSELRKFNEEDLPFGNIIPDVTPLTRNPDGSLSLDLAGNERYMQLLAYMANQAHLPYIYLFNVGATGESVKLGSLRQEAVREKTLASKRHKFIAFTHVTGENLTETLENIRVAEGAKADSLVIAPLLFLDDLEVLEETIRAISRATRLPLIVYNNPGIHKKKGTNISSQLIEKLYREGLIIAIKDSSGNLDQLQSYIDTGIPTYTGNEGGVFDARAKGARGTVGSSGSLILNFLWSLSSTRSEESRRKLQERMNALRPTLTMSLNPDKIPAVIKYVLSKIEVDGVPVMNPTMVRPQDELTAKEKAIVDRIMPELYEMGLPKSIATKRAELRSTARIAASRQINLVLKVSRLFRGGILPALPGRLAEKIISRARGQAAESRLAETKEARDLFKAIQQNHEKIAPVVNVPDLQNKEAIRQILEASVLLVRENKAQAHRVVFKVADADMDRFENMLTAYLVQNFPEALANQTGLFPVVSSNNRLIGQILENTRSVEVDWNDTMEPLGLIPDQVSPKFYANRLTSGSLIPGFDRPANKAYAATLLQATQLLLYGPQASGVGVVRGYYAQASANFFSRFSMIFQARQRLASAA